MAKLPKILIITDSPALHTGMGIVHKELATRLYLTKKYEIHSLGWFFHSIEQRGGKWIYPWPQYTVPDHGRPYGHPGNYSNKKDIDWGTCPVNKLVEDIKPNVVIGLGDAWMLDYINDMPTRNKFKFIWEIPLDGVPVPLEWIETFKRADLPVVMSKFAQKALLDRDPYFKVEVNPRGINTNIFRKHHASKEALRDKAFPEAKGRFLVGVFDRFQDRKQIGRAIEAFDKFMKKGRHTDCDIYLHMAMQDPASINQGKTLVGPNGLLKRYHLDGSVLYRTDLTVEHGVREDYLAALYNCCDVKLSTSQGEGWGLTTIEAMACGLPCIGTNYTTFPEFFDDGRGLLADVQATITGMYNVERALVSTDHVSELLEQLYRNPKLRAEMGSKAAEWAKQFNWNSNIQNWISMIERCLRKSTFDSPVKPIPGKTETIEKAVNIQGAVYENTGFSIVTKNLALALDKLGINVSVEPRVLQLRDSFDAGEEINKLIDKPKNNVVEFINHMQGEQLTRIPESNAKYRIAYFPWELSRIEPVVVEMLNTHADGVWCNSQFTADIYKSCGVQEEKLAVIPNGICLPRVERKIGRKTYRFLSAGNLGDVRKNTKTLVYAYLNTFTAKDDVTLVLKSQPGHDKSDPTALVEFLSSGIKSPPAVEIIHGDYTDQQMAELFAGCDCYITASHAEGFCQPILEACSVGMPIIAPLYGGYLEFAQNENFFGLPVIMVDAGESPVSCLYAEWSEVSYKGLCDVMLEVFKNRVTSEGENFVPEHTWGNSAKIFVKELDKLIKRCEEPKLKVYYENFTRNLWNNANRDGFRRYAPACVEFVDDYSHADLQVLDITRLSDKNNIKCNNYVALFHCRGEWSEENIMDYVAIFEGADLVYSHLDLEELMTGDDKWSKAEFEKRINFFRGPWGVDETLFHSTPAVRHYDIMSTGEIPQTEGITECLTACMNIEGKLVHVGPNLGYKDKAYRNTMNLTVEQMMVFYNSSKYVNALRRIEGFEKPAIEGALCGARPICFDTPLYRHWYRDIPIYVKEGTFEETTKDLTLMLKNEPKEITEKERQYIIDKFSWRFVAKNFWDKYLCKEGTDGS